MTAVGSLIIAGLVLILVALALSGKLRVIVQGFIGLFVEDLAKTPEGANAIYNQAIEKAQDDYNKANDTLQRVAGQLDTAKRSYEEALNARKDIEAKCEQFAQKGLFDKVELIAQKRNEILEDLAVQERAVKELTPLYEEAKKINNFLEQKLKTLQKDKTRAIADLKLTSQLKNMYDSMDELKNTTDVDKLLSNVKTGVQESREKAVGAKVVHENKLSTKLSSVEAEAKKLQNDEFVEQLKKKYAK